MEGIEAGWQHFAGADWAAARDAFAAALGDDPDPEALDGLGQSLWWLGERDAGIERRREAYAAYRRRGRRAPGGAARDLPGRRGADRRPGAPRPRAGWRGRGACSTGAGTVPELGWLAIEEAKRAADPAAAERHARAALAVAHALADPDVECMALAQLGRAVVGQGRVQEGVGLLDEAMTVALGGESSDPLACGDACCTTLVVCDGLADLPRAAQWCEAVVDFTERRGYTPLQSWCRAIYGAVLVRAGDWERAEAVLAESLLRRAGPRAAAAATCCRSRCSPSCGSGRAAATRPSGCSTASTTSRPRSPRSSACAWSAASSTTRRALLDRGAGEDGERLVLRGEVALAGGELAAADAIAARLRAVAGDLARDDLAADAALLAGRAAAVRGDGAAAARELDAAVGRLRRAGLSAGGGPRAARARRRARRRRLAARARVRARGARRLRAPRRAPRRRRGRRAAARAGRRPAAAPRAAGATS